MVALALAVASLVACTAGDGGAHSNGPLLPTSVDALPDMNAGTFETLMAQQRGTPVMVNIWASWCTPCQEETPDIVRAHATWGDRVRFIGVDVQDDRSGATTFLTQYGVTYPSVFNPANDRSGSPRIARGKRTTAASPAVARRSIAGPPG